MTLDTYAKASVALYQKYWGPQFAGEQDAVTDSRWTLARGAVLTFFLIPKNLTVQVGDPGDPGAHGG